VGALKRSAVKRPAASVPHTRRARRAVDTSGFSRERKGRLCHCLYHVTRSSPSDPTQPSTETKAVPGARNRWPPMSNAATSGVTEVLPDERNVDVAKAMGENASRPSVLPWISHQDHISTAWEALTRVHGIVGQARGGSTRGVVAESICQCLQRQGRTCAQQQRAPEIGDSAPLRKRSVASSPAVLP